jgi:outer membrane protein assembly factor BamB
MIRLISAATAALFTCGAADQALAGNWPTYAGSSYRQGNNPSETVLTPATVPNMTLHWSAQVGAAQTVTQPVYVENVNTLYGTHNEVFTAEEYSTISAYNAVTGKRDWRTQLPTNQIIPNTCIDKVMGVQGTPTVDPVAQALYVVDGYGALHALSTHNGVEKTGYPVQLIDPVNYANGGYNHSSPTLVGSMLYVTTSGTNACEDWPAPYHGAVYAFNTQTQAISNTFFSMTSGAGGGIWGPGGAMSDPVTGRLFVGTGNGLDLQVPTAYAISIVALDPNLNVLDHHSPGKPTINPLGDLDFASTPTPIDAPNCPPLMSVLNKNGDLFLYQRNSLGTGPTQILVVTQGGGNSAAIGSAAYDPNATLLILNNPLPSKNGAYTNGAVAFMVNAGCTLTPVWQTTFGLGTYTINTKSFQPVIAGGVVYVVSGPSASVLAFNELTGAPLWSSGSIFTTPTIAPVAVADGQLFVQSGKYLYVFGL